MNLESLAGKRVYVKLRSQKEPQACTVASVELSGVWLAGTALLPAQQAKTLGSAAVFVPFAEMEWLAVAPFQKT